MSVSSLKRLAAVCATFVALAGALPLDAQQTTGAIRGRITNPQGQGVASAQVTVRNAATGFERSVIADANGRYLVPLIVPGGPYTLSVTSIGFATDQRPNLNVSAGSTQTRSEEHTSELQSRLH